MDERAPGTRRSRPPSGATPAGAVDLVAALWRHAPPDTWSPGHPAADVRAGLRKSLGRVAARATAAARRQPNAERPALQLLAETARAIEAALSAIPAQPVAAPDPRAGAGGALASPLRLRLARMERWLDARAASDPGAEAAANLCLWVLEHLEADGA